LQNYPNLEYIIIDGGSSDGSVDIIKKYEPWLTWWVSEPDKGQSDAINKGFKKATGVYGNWINSDDLLAENALRILTNKMDLSRPNAVYLGDYIEFNGKTGRIIRKRSDIRNLEQLVDINNHWRRVGGNQIGQQATFFPLHLFRKVGMLNANNHHTMDYELWGRFLIAGAEFIPVHEILGYFRIYPGQKISEWHKQTISLIKSALILVDAYDNWNPDKKKLIRNKLLNYKKKIYYRQFRSKIGIKRRLKSLLKHFQNQSYY
jgi:glycosyltransferase involved in cell wall biosynthesis